jgi:hypothetical protein
MWVSIVTELGNQSMGQSKSQEAGFMKWERIVRTSSVCAIIFLLLGTRAAHNVFAATSADSCAANSESRQLDYWLGDWKVSAPGSSGNATSKVYLSLEKCLVIESWDGGRGHIGLNTFAYNVEEKSWYGLFADNDGRVHVFNAGKVSSGTAEFQGTSRTPEGGAVLNRVRVIRVTPNKVAQTWEKSTDNGASWNLVFRGEYSRANP